MCEFGTDRLSTVNSPLLFQSNAEFLSMIRSKILACDRNDFDNCCRISSSGIFSARFLSANVNYYRLFAMAMNLLRNSPRGRDFYPTGDEMIRAFSHIFQMELERIFSCDSF